MKDTTTAPAPPLLELRGVEKRFALDQSLLERLRFRDVPPRAISPAGPGVVSAAPPGVTILAAARVISRRSCGELASSSKTGWATTLS